jgi:hypothetical protein
MTYSLGLIEACVVTVHDAWNDNEPLFGEQLTDMSDGTFGYDRVTGSE